MEFILQSTEGVPENAVLSMKVGETKRQGSVSKLGQPFRFASSMAEPLPVKVELLSPAAPEQTIKVIPTEKTVVVHFGGAMSVTLLQRAAQEMQRPLADVKEAAKSPGLSTDKLQKAQSAAAYLDQHDLVRTFQDILHGLLITKPVDPFAYLEEHVARAKALFESAKDLSQPAAPDSKQPASTVRSDTTPVPICKLEQARSAKFRSAVGPETTSPPQPTGETDLPNPPQPTGQPQPPDEPPPSVRPGSKGIGRRQSGLRGSIVSQSKVEALLDILSRTSQNLPLVLPLLPKPLQDTLTSPQLADECQKQFKALDVKGEGKLGPEQLVPVIVQLSTANERAVSAEICKKFINIFDANEGGCIQIDEFTMLTQFVIISAFLEAPEGTELLANAQMEEKRFEQLLEVLSSDRDRLVDVIPFLPDWFVIHLSSDSFMDECNFRFDALDQNGKGELSPQDLLPVVLQLSKANPAAVDFEKLRRFVKIFDIAGNGVIQQDEFIDFAQFMAVMSFLNTTVEGQQIAQASVDFADRSRVNDQLMALTSDPSQLPQVMETMPQALLEIIKSNKFAMKCKEHFVLLDRSRKGRLEFATLIPAIIDSCKEHPIQVNKDNCKEYCVVFDADKKGTVGIGQVVSLIQFVIVIAYLTSCKEWHDSTIQNSREKIERLLVFLKGHKDRIDDIIPFLPPDVREDLLSPEFAENCAEEFRNKDTDNSGVLEPKELIPLILQLSEGQQLALTYDHVTEFLALFDTLKNGVLTAAEYVDFARFMVIVAYVQTSDGLAVRDAAEINAGKRQVEELLEMLEADRSSLHKVVPLLPKEVFEGMTSPDFINRCQESFRQLDTDKNGTLSPEELCPVVVELSQAHPYAIDLHHCMEFTKIFDVHGDGVIREDEFMDFARYLCVMNYLQSPDGRQKVNDGLLILADSRKIEELLTKLRQDRGQIQEVLPYLPDEFQDDLLGKRFANKCAERFKKLDVDGNGTLDHAELFPVLLEMSHAHKLALDVEQCKRFTDIFDEDRTGVITKQEFVSFARFMMVMSFLQTEDGQKTLKIATAAEKKVQKNAEGSSMSQSTAVSAYENTREIVPAGADLKHLTVDIQFYQARSEKLSRENESLRHSAFNMETTIRRLECCIEEQDKLLKHAEIDLKPPGRNMVRQ